MIIAAKIASDAEVAALQAALEAAEGKSADQVSEQEIRKSSPLQAAASRQFSFAFFEHRLPGPIVAVLMPSWTDRLQHRPPVPPVILPRPNGTCSI